MAHKRSLTGAMVQLLMTSWIEARVKNHPKWSQLTLPLWLFQKIQKDDKIDREVPLTNIEVALNSLVDMHLYVYFLSMAREWGRPFRYHTFSRAI